MISKNSNCFRFNTLRASHQNLPWHDLQGRRLSHEKTEVEDLSEDLMSGLILERSSGSGVYL